MRAFMHLLYEIPQHPLGDIEISDDPVLERPDGKDMSRRPADHALGVHAHGHDLAVFVFSATTEGSLSTIPRPRT